MLSWWFSQWLKSTSQLASIYFIHFPGARGGAEENMSVGSSGRNPQSRVLREAPFVLGQYQDKKHDLQQLCDWTLR